MPDNRLSPKDLAKMPASLVGAGEWAHSGHPKTANPNLLTGAASSTPPATGNMLLGAPTDAGPAMNLLTGGASLPVTAPPAPEPIAAPPPAAPAVPAGQERHAAVGKALGADKLTDDELSARLGRSMFVQGALQKLLQQSDVDHGDVAQVLADGIKRGGIPATDGPTIMAAIPADPAKLRGALENLHLAAAHAAVHIVGEQGRRKGAAQ